VAAETIAEISEISKRMSRCERQSVRLPEKFARWLPQLRPRHELVDTQLMDSVLLYPGSLPKVLKDRGQAW